MTRFDNTGVAVYGVHGGTAVAMLIINGLLRAALAILNQIENHRVNKLVDFQVRQLILNL